MCVGVPMRVIEVGEGTALVAADGEVRRVSTMLLGDAPRRGDHVLVHVGAALRVIDAEEAALVADALRAVMAAADGQPFEHLVADLIDREPQLPDHLKGAA